MALYWEGGELSATATPQAKTFGQVCTSLLIYNAGANEVFIDINAAAVADTSHFNLASGKSISIDVDKRSSPIVSLGYVCDTAETATVHYAAMRGIQTR